MALHTSVAIPRMDDSDRLTPFWLFNIAEPILFKLGMYIYRMTHAAILTAAIAVLYFGTR